MLTLAYVFVVRSLLFFELAKHIRRTWNGSVIDTRNKRSVFNFHWSCPFVVRFHSKLTSFCLQQRFLSQILFDLEFFRLFIRFRCAKKFNPTETLPDIYMRVGLSVACRKQSHTMTFRATLFCTHYYLFFLLFFKKGAGLVSFSFWCWLFAQKNLVKYWIQMLYWLKQYKVIKALNRTHMNLIIGRRGEEKGTQ